jgi:uncharacterized protein (TIGR00255 family)
MSRSMTGYGRSLVIQDGHEMAFEIKSLNHRYMDIHMRLPRNLTFLEEEIRQIVQERISRGRIEVHVNYQNVGPTSKKVEIDYGLLEAYMKAFDDVEKKTSLKDDITLSFIMELPDVVMITEEEENDEILKSIVRRGMNEALDELILMREHEGKKLTLDILDRIEYIHEMVAKIEERAPFVVQEYKEKLKERIQELLQDSTIDEARFNTEVAYFADRSNITEEIVRLKSHMSQLRAALDANHSVGRKLDFIIQEMNRETNTIGSKASDLEIINIVVEIKSEIEKIREQAQNIE